MSKETYAELKKTAEEINQMLRQQDLRIEERQKLEELQASISGALLSSWLPFGFVRRVTMGALFFVGLYGIWVGGLYLLVAWFLLLLFSPRIVGISCYAIGKILGR